MKGGDIMKGSYIGKIKNAGQQTVKAPNQVKNTVKGGKVVTGADLRSGKNQADTK